MKRRDRAPHTKTDPARHLMQCHHAVCEEDQHGAVIRISLPPAAVLIEGLVMQRILTPELCPDKVFYAAFAALARH